MNVGTVYLRNGVTRRQADLAIQTAEIPGPLCQDCRPDVVVHGVIPVDGHPGAQLQIVHAATCPWLNSHQDEDGEVHELRVVHRRQ